MKLSMSQKPNKFNLQINLKNLKIKLEYSKEKSSKDSRKLSNKMNLSKINFKRLTTKEN